MPLNPDRNSLVISGWLDWLSSMSHAALWESMKVTPENVRDFILAGMACEHVEVSGDGRHFEAVIVSRAFEGKSLLERQRLVFQSLGDRMEQIHALSMKTYTPEQWAEKRT